MITSGTPLNTPNGMLIGSGVGGGDPTRGEMLMVRAFYCTACNADAV